MTQKLTSRQSQCSPLYLDHALSLGDDCEEDETRPSKKTNSLQSNWADGRKVTQESEQFDGTNASTSSFEAHMRRIDILSRI